MSASTRFRAEMQRSDTEHVTPLAELDLFTEHRTFLAFDPLTIAESGSFTVPGFSSISEVYLDTDGAAVTVELTKAGPVSFQMTVSHVLYLNHADLTGLRLINPSSVVELPVKLLVGGQ